MAGVVVAAVVTGAGPRPAVVVAVGVVARAALVAVGMAAAAAVLPAAVRSAMAAAVAAPGQGDRVGAAEAVAIVLGRGGIAAGGAEQRGAGQRRGKQEAGRPAARIVRDLDHAGSVEVGLNSLGDPARCG